MTIEQKAQRRNEDREFAVRSQLDVWRGQNERLSSLLFELSDEELAREVSPGRNTGTYILGHLAAVSDGMLPVLGFGDRLFPTLEESFLAEPQHAELARPAAGEVRRVWADLTGVLDENFRRFDANDWFEKGNSPVEDELETTPLNSRLNVLIIGTDHLACHLSQLRLLKGMSGN